MKGDEVSFTSHVGTGSREHVLHGAAPISLATSSAVTVDQLHRLYLTVKKGKGSPYWIAERRVPELIPVLDSQPAGDVSYKTGGRLPLLSARPAVTPATLKRTAINFAA